MEQDATHPLPLRGIRVLDLTRVLAGPYCTMILADLGADVVKIEKPEVGDDARHFGPFLPSGRSAYFASLNRGKKSIALDLRSDPDRDTFRKLVSRTDVVVENFRAGTMSSFGLGYEELKAIQPTLIYASLSGFGHDGLDTDRAAYDVVIQAMSGLMSITGEGPGKHVRVGSSISDILTGMFGAIAIVSAIRHRDVTGKGTVIDLAMLDCTIAALENAISRYSVSGQSPEPLGTRHPSITPFQAFQTSDGPIVIAAGNDNLWRKMCQVLDCQQLVDDPRFATNDVRTQNRDALEECLLPVFRMRTQADWLGRLDEAGVPAAPIRSIEQVVKDPHVASREILHRLRDVDNGSFLTAGSPFRMNGHAVPLSDSAPELGQDDDAVLEQWSRET